MLGQLQSHLTINVLLSFVMTTYYVYGLMNFKIDNACRDYYTVSSLVYLGTRLCTRDSILHQSFPTRPFAKTTSFNQVEIMLFTSSGFSHSAQ